ncbi:MAG: hypothetical protein AB7S65_09820 [Sulfuricurvum sp.]
MLDTIRGIETLFLEIDRLLADNSPDLNALCDVTQQAYVLMNEGMCEDLSVCHDCAKHRDFLYEMLPILEHSRDVSPFPDTLLTPLETYRTVVRNVLERVQTILLTQ